MKNLRQLEAPFLSPRVYSEQTAQADVRRVGEKKGPGSRENGAAEKDRKKRGDDRES